MLFKCLMGVVVLGASAFWSAAPVAESEDAGTYSIDSGHSCVLFKVSHLNVSNFYGRFNEVSGTLTIADDPTQSAIEISIPTESIDTNSKDRDDHLKGSDFFNVKEFPTLSFKSSKVEKTGAGFRVTGELSLHGKTKEITFDATHTGHGESGRFGYRTGYEAKFTIQRTDFGMSYLTQMLGDEVTIMVALEAVKG